MTTSKLHKFYSKTTYESKFTWIYTKVTQKCFVSSRKFSINYSALNLPGIF